MTNNSPEPIICEYPYHLKTKILLYLLEFSAMTCCVAYTAYYNHKGLVINHLIYLSPANATIFYWCLCFFATALILMGMLALKKQALSKKRIALTASGILICELRSWEEILIPYNSITSLDKKHFVKKLISSTHEHVWLILTLNNGRKRSISRDMLPSHEAFEDLGKRIAQQMQIAKSAPTPPPPPDGTTQIIFGRKKPS